MVAGLIPLDLVNLKNQILRAMASVRRLRSLLRSGPLVLLLGFGGMAVAVAAPRMGLPVVHRPRSLTARKRSLTRSGRSCIAIIWILQVPTDESRWRQLRRSVLAKSYAGTGESYEAIRGMLASLDDPYTRFLDPKEFKEMQIDTSGELRGVGIQLSLDKETKELIVVAPIDGTPASRAGVQPKDVIVSIDGESTRGMTTEDAVKLIRGPEGSEVVLGLRRQGAVISVSLKRARIRNQCRHLQPQYQC